MTRRPALIAAAALVAFGLAAFVPTADALTAKTRQCVKDARDRLKARNVQDRIDARGAFATEFTSCFGPGADCANGCLEAQAGCQGPFKDAARGDQEVCKAEFEKKLGDCRLPAETDPQQCASAARLIQFACNQDAAAAAAPGLQGCSSEFGQCTAACASDR